MRRLPASLLLALFLGWIVLPFAPVPAHTLAACCLRNGKHHCQGMGGPDGFRAACSACPYRGAATVPPACGTALPGSTFAAASAAIGERRVCDLSRPAAGILPGSLHKRGPPDS